MPFKKIIKSFGVEAAGAKEFPEKRKLKKLSEEEWNELVEKRKKGRGLHGRRQMSDKEFKELEEMSR